MRPWQGGGWLAGVRQVFSPNYGMRPQAGDVSLIVIHHISLPPDQFGGDWVARFFLNQLDPAAHPYFAEIARQQVSAHFYVRRSGAIVQFVDCDARAWHAGLSSWQGRANCNDYSVGIELEGSDRAAFSPGQEAALDELIEVLCRRYPIRAVAGHCHIAPGRKTDPGPCFDWGRMRRRFPGLCLPSEVGG